MHGRRPVLSRTLGRAVDARTVHIMAVHSVYSIAAELYPDDLDPESRHGIDTPASMSSLLGSFSEPRDLQTLETVL